MGCYRAKQRSQPAEARFWPKVNKTEGCWLWTGAKFSRGYGEFTIFRDGRWRTIGAHVFAYELATGEQITDGSSVLHHCDVRACVRPDHLFKGTHKMNMEDAAMKGRLSVPRPGNQKLSAEQVYELRDLVASGMPQIRVAERYGISEVLVSFLVRGLRRQYDAPLKAS